MLLSRLEHGEMAPPLSVEKRRLLLASTSLLKALGHSGFDRLLLEWGMPGDVGSGASLMARANSLARYVLTNSDMRVPAGKLLCNEVIQRARELNQRENSANVGERERAEYQEALSAFDPGSIDAPPVKAPISRRIGPDVPEEAKLPAGRPKPRRKVFIVHGRDPAPREAVARFLAKLDFEPIILHERPNRGRAIITKFQEEAADVGFAVVLMTADDHGSVVGEDLKPRARQNVVFELGFFIGALGADRVAALMHRDVERPSDFDGVVYISLDQGNSWKHELARELHTAGFEIDWQKVII
jgi:predicted nucleotide-binding protein